MCARIQSLRARCGVLKALDSVNMSSMRAKRLTKPRGRTSQGERITTPYGRLMLGCFDVADMDRESRETVVRCLEATMARMDADAEREKEEPHQPG